MLGGGFGSVPGIVVGGGVIDKIGTGSDAWGEAKVSSGKIKCPEGSERKLTGRDTNSYVGSNEYASGIFYKVSDSYYYICIQK